MRTSQLFYSSLLAVLLCACGEVSPPADDREADAGVGDANGRLADSARTDGDAGPALLPNIAEVLGRPWSRTAPFQPNPVWKATCEAELPATSNVKLPGMPASSDNCAGNPAACGPTKDQDCRSEPALSSWLHRVTVDTSAFPDAVCNDGSPAIIEVSKGRGEGANQWLIWFKGGGGCANQHFCAQRWCGSRGGQYTASIMSSDWNGDGVVDNAFCSNTEAGSAFDRDLEGSPFADANLIRIRYCGSDAHAGDAGDVALLDLSADDPDDRAFSAHFRGHAIAATVVEMLKNGVVSDDGAVKLASIDLASRVVIAGSSAGGGGALHNMDFVHEQLRASNPEVVVRGVIDASVDTSFETLQGAGVFVDAALDEMATEGLDYAQFRRDHTMASWDGFRRSINAFADQSCADYYASRPELMYNCLEFPLLLTGRGDGERFIQTQIFLRRDLSDPIVGRHYLGCIDFSTGLPCYQADHSPLSYDNRRPKEWLGIPDANDHIGQTLQDLALAGPDTAVTGIFAPSCGSHTGFINRAFSRQYTRHYDQDSGFAGEAHNFVDTLSYWLATNLPVQVVDASPEEASSSSECGRL